MKTCTTCGETKPLTEFYRQTRGKFGVTGACKACRGIKQTKFARRARGARPDDVPPEARFIALFVETSQFRIDPDGRVWQLGRARANGRGPRRLELFAEPRPVKTPAGRPCRNGTTYIVVRASAGCEWHVVRAHRLVWTYFVGPISDGIEVNHKNGRRDDNRLDNLELVTSRGNSLHARDVLGRSDFKLSRSKAERIRVLYATGAASQVELATMFGVKQGHISGILRGEHWSD